MIRSHAAIKFAAGFFRVGAIVTAIATGVLVYQGFQLGAAIEEFARAQPGSGRTFGIVVGVVLILYGGTYSVLLWAVADTLILIADSDDNLRLLRADVAELLRRVSVTSVPATSRVNDARRGTVQLSAPSSLPSSYGARLRPQAPGECRRCGHANERRDFPRCERCNLLWESDDAARDLAPRAGISSADWEVAASVLRRWDTLSEQDRDIAASGAAYRLRPLVEGESRYVDDTDFLFGLGAALGMTVSKTQG